MATKREIEIARYFCELLSDANPPDSWYERELRCISHNIEEERREFEETFSKSISPHRPDIFKRFILNECEYDDPLTHGAWGGWKLARGIE